MPADRISDEDRIAQDILADDNKRRPGGQGHPLFPDGEVEGVRMQQDPHVVGAEVEVCGGVEQCDDVGVTDHDALRTTGRARGVDQIRRISGEQSACAVGVADRFRRHGVEVPHHRRVCDVDDRRPHDFGEPPDVESISTVGQHCTRCGVLQQEFDPVVWIIRVHRNVHSARAHDCREHDGQPLVTRGHHRDAVAGAHTR